ncbi:MAG: hypothetical protein C0596_06360 [Marinilabiliales bacterium]|nr:MAG: hypothetical protein C0596_06360 [Marinilabiliales bacterium]
MNQKKESISWLINFLLSGLGLYLFDKFIGSRIDWTEIDFLSFLSYPVTLTVVDIFVFILLFLAGYLIIKSAYIRQQSYYTKDQKKLKERNCEYNAELGVLFKWHVLFDYNDKHFIGDLTPYCMKHGNPPLRMIKRQSHYLIRCFECSIPGCKNEVNLATYQFVKNYIESGLIQEYSQMKAKKTKKKVKE